MTTFITKCIQRNAPILFLKLGDGEYQCVNRYSGGNCDRDIYTPKLSENLKMSIKFLMDENSDNILFGQWHSSQLEVCFWTSLSNCDINWEKYHSLMIDSEDTIEKIELYKSIKTSKLKKIIVCNPLLIKSKILLDADYLIHVPFNNWFDTQFENVLNQIKDLFEKDEQFIMITSCGMGAKVLLCECFKLYPQSIFLDFGSAIDLICTKKISRGWELSYEKYMQLLSEIIPANWDDEKFNFIYNDAIYKLGVHL
jgi:hypothetical protein